MANIIEQQDLLKGLPDNRLATLMQNPTGEIPPFLVAAEAQRRQAIRQQFSGGEQESVVDSLISQMANTPENIQGPAQSPQMPQLPQQGMEGAQDAGLGAIDQGMRDGGMVRRFAEDGYVRPMWTLPDYSSYLPKVGEFLKEAGQSAYEMATKPYGETAPALPGTEDVANPAERLFPTLPPGASAGMSLTKMTIPPSAQKGKEDTSDENQEAPDPRDEERRRLKELYGETELSNWEKAQKWFAASEALVTPGQTTTQALINAAGAFGDSAADAAKAERMARLEAGKGLLEYDIAARKEDDDLARAGATARRDIATTRIGQIERQRGEIANQISEIQMAVAKGGLDPATAEPYLKGLRDQYDKFNQDAESYNAFFDKNYGFNTIPRVNTATGKIEG